MIKISEKRNCCGCMACVQKCPQHCISMEIDDEGFNYPKVDLDSCINCGLCEKVCPIINVDKVREPLSCYAAHGKNEDIVKNSSSAGVFYLLAEYIINCGGVVFGAKFNSLWDVEHAWADNMDGVQSFMGSKYVQSYIGDSYKNAEFFLKSGRKVLFTGTPCQVAGLRRFLRRSYDNLFCVDVVCHGVPSPGIWREYLKSLLNPIVGKRILSNSLFSPLCCNYSNLIKEISFRDNRLGWKKYGFSISVYPQQVSKKYKEICSYKPLLFQKHYHNLYMKAFLNNFLLRPSCYNCPARKGKSGSDILLGDYWGIARYYPDFYNSKGVSMILTYTVKGANLLDKIDLKRISVHYSETSGNSNIEFDENIPDNRADFFKDFHKNGVLALKMHNKKFEKNILHLYIQNIINKFKMLIK